MAFSKHTICALVNLLNTGKFDEFQNKYNKAFHLMDYEYDVQRDFEGVPGLIYISNFLDTEEVAYLQEFISSLKFEPITSAANSRRVAQYGYTYAYDRSGVTKTDPIPLDLCEMVSASKLNNLMRCNMVSSEFDQLIINEYTPGQQIAYHTDHIKQFDEVIACVTVGQSVPIMFKLDDDVVKELDVKSGSMYIMTGDARYKWKHHLKNTGAENRYSLTFRKVKNIEKITL